MNTTLLLGPAASGKTQSCLNIIRAFKQEQTRASVWVVLPDRAQVVAFRRRFADGGGGLGVRIETVQALIEEIVIRLGVQRPRASAPVRRRMVQTSLEELNQAGDIPHFSPIANTAGLSHVLSERFLELKRAGWSPDKLDAALSSPGQAVQEILSIFSRYQSHLERVGWEDGEGMARLATQGLRGNTAVLSPIQLVLMDGFDSFSPNQIGLLSALSDTINQLVVTLPMRSETGQEDFPRFQQAYERLMDAIPELNIRYCQHEGSRSSSLRLLSQRVFTSAVGESGEAVSGVEWLKARSIDQEVRESLRWIKAANRRHSLPLRDCALVLTDPVGYEPFVREAAREYGIPLLFGGGKHLDQAPSIVALFDLLDLPLSNWPRRLTLEAIRSPFFDLTEFNLDAADATPLEAASYWGQVVAGLDQWEQTLHTLAQRQQEASVEPMEVSSVPLPSPEQASRMNQGLRRFGSRLSVGQPRSLAEWVTWLEDLLQDLSFFEQAESSEEEAALLRLREVFRAMMLSEAVVGATNISYQTFIADLKGSLERVRYQPRIDWQTSALQVEGIQAARGLRFEAVAILGLSEGQLPVVEREDPFFDEALREQLDLEPRIGRDQPSLFYEGITRANGSLLLTRPTLSEDGESWEPSPFWRESLRVFGMSDDEVRLLQSGADRPMSQAASPQEVAFLAVRRGSLPDAYQTLAPRLEPLRQARSLIESRLAEDPAGEFEGGLHAVADELADRYGEQHVWSPSRLESYGTCPHFFLTAQLFGLEQLEEPALGPDVRQLGSLLHRILELAYGEAQDPTDPDQVLKKLRPLAEQAFESAPSEFGFRPSPLWQVESEQLTADLEQTVLALAELDQGWEPAAFEAMFGLAGAPPLVLETEAGAVRIRGVIDRVDRKGDQVRIIDYKTGSSHLGPADLVRGRRLQLPLYALAAEKALKLGRVSDGFYWVIRSAKPGGLRLGRFSASWEGASVDGPEGSYRVLQDHVSSYLKSLRSGDYPPIPPQGGCPQYCPAADWCWRYTPGYQR